MASQFQEIISLNPESFRLKLDDAKNNPIDFIFALDSNSISAVDDDDDGFRTPTSSDYKIPEVEHCPPAPRRPKPLSRTSPRVSGVRRGFRVYISNEIAESIFSSSSFGSDILLHPKNKKARKDEVN